jgi:uncharacterized protein (UPF0332 family)
MNPRDYLRLADELAGGAGEAEWRSAASRAYYGAFHVARALLVAAGFSPPPDAAAHAFVWLRLSNAGHPDVNGAGDRLRDLRRARTWADYDLSHPYPERAAVEQVARAMDVIGTLDDLAASPAVLARVIDAIRTYERDVLQDVSWRPPSP